MDFFMGQLVLPPIIVPRLDVLQLPREGQTRKDDSGWIFRMNPLDGSPSPGYQISHVFAQIFPQPRALFLHLIQMSTDILSSDENLVT